MKWQELVISSDHLYLFKINAYIHYTKSVIPSNQKQINYTMNKINANIRNSNVLLKRKRFVHLIRFHTYKSIDKITTRLNPKGVGLTIADWRPVISSMMPNVTFYNLRYPEYNIMDLNQIPDNSVDVFYSEMILEHIDNPQKAIDETYRILKPGGIAIHTTVFLMPYHPCPRDLYRFSPDLLADMHNKFTQTYTGGNGNWRTLLVLLLRLSRFPVSYRWGGLPGLLLRGNDPKYMITTWVVAQK